jgi:hypothetical protein
MDTTPTETPEERKRLLRTLTPRERVIVEAILADYPTLTAAKCIEHCRAFGM